MLDTLTKVKGELRRDLRKLLEQRGMMASTEKGGQENKNSKGVIS